MLSDSLDVEKSEREILIHYPTVRRLRMIAVKRMLATAETLSLVVGKVFVCPVKIAVNNLFF